jgi:hypothetical protein
VELARGERKTEPPPNAAPRSGLDPVDLDVDVAEDFPFSVAESGLLPVRESSAVSLMRNGAPSSVGNVNLVDEVDSSEMVSPSSVSDVSVSSPIRLVVFARAVRDEALPPFDGEGVVPVNSRRSWSGSMFGAVRRCGDWRTVLLRDEALGLGVPRITG